MVRCINRMHEEIPGAHAEGRVLLDGLDVYDPSVDVVAVRRAIGMVFQKPNPFPTMSVFDNVAAGLRLSSRGRGDLRPKVEAALRSAGLWDEVSDRLTEPGRRAVGRPAAAAVHRALARRRTRGDPDGRALLGARPDRDAQDRGADRSAEEQGDDRDRHPQHAAGRARGRPHRVHARRRARRGRRRPRRSSPTRATREPRNMSPESSASADGRHSAARRGRPAAGARCGRRGQSGAGALSAAAAGARSPRAGRP